MEQKGKNELQETSMNLTTSGDEYKEQKRMLRASQATFFSEIEAIDLCLTVIELLETVHSRGVVHTNLCPEEIFLKDKKLT